MITIGSTTFSATLAALFAVIIWGMTFVTTKVLLRDLSPFQILLLRFTIGYGVLWLLTRRRMVLASRWHELYFALGGFLGITLYFLLENKALLSLKASHVAILVSTIPLFTGLLSRKNLHIRFFIGCLVAMIGIALIETNGQLTGFELNIGVLFALGGALAWSLYTLVGRRLAMIEGNSLLVTRRCFAWGLVLMLPLFWFLPEDRNWPAVLEFHNLWRIGFLGVTASALCFAAWAYAVKHLGAVRSTVFLYLNPIIAIVLAWFALGEQFTIIQIFGTILILAGVYICENK